MQITSGSSVMKKRIAVSGKRQITIPIEFYNRVGIQNEVDCYIKDGAIVIRPAQDTSGGEFAEQILADLITQGYAGDVLLKKFRQMNKAMRPAVEKLLVEADAAAKGQGAYATFEDIFGAEESEEAEES